jgi:tetratricopeptide (TPR) repeat protein
MTRTRTDSKGGVRRLAGSYLALALCAAALTTAGHARAEQAEERALARGHFNRGVELAKAGAYESALAEFKQAYQISPHFSVLYNIAQAELALERPQLAVEALRRYLAEGGERIEPARRAEVESTITTELERSSPREAVNDPARATAPLVEPQPAPAAAPAPSTQRPARAPVGATASTPADDSHGDAKRPLAYVLGATGIVLASAALAHYAWNRGRYEDWQESYDLYHEDPRPARRSAANELAESVERASRVTIALAIGAGVTLGTGTVLFFSSSTTSPAHAGSDERWLGVRGTF